MLYRRLARKIDAEPPACRRSVGWRGSTYPDITAQRVFEELRAKGYGGGYTMVRERVRDMRPKTPVISLPTPEYRPGQR